MKVTVLGCGASWGVPAIGPDWGRCDPTDPRNRRRRCSLLVETQSRTILIDTAPDLREQLIDARVSRLDAGLLTHAHPGRAVLAKPRLQPDARFPHRPGRLFDRCRRSRRYCFRRARRHRVVGRRLPAPRAAPDACQSREGARLGRTIAAEAHGADPYGPEPRLSRAQRRIAGRGRARA